MNTIDQSKDTLAKRYDLFADKFNELYLSGTERGHDAMEVALEKAREQLTTLGEFNKQQGEDLKRYLARDLDQTKVDMAALGEGGMEKFQLSQLGAGALASLVSLLDSTSSALRSLSSMTSATLAYHTGEMTSAGTLTCKKCGQTVKFKATGHVPPCPKCNATEFSKGY